MFKLIARLITYNSMHRSVSWFDYNIKTLLIGVGSAILFYFINLLLFNSKLFGFKKKFILVVGSVILGYFVYKISYEFYLIVDISNLHLQ